jgi:hypothetical protein
MVDFFQSFGYAYFSVCLPSSNLKSIAATMLAHLFESHLSNDASASSKALDG